MRPSGVNPYEPVSHTPKFVIIKNIIADKKSPAALNLIFWQKYLETKPINNTLSEV